MRSPERLIVAPTDLRSIDPFVADEILDGRYPLAGRVLDTQGDSPFEIDLPSREFAVRLHGFSWLRHLRASKDPATLVRVRQLISAWIETHGRSVGGISWEADVAARRVISWLSHSPIILRNAEQAYYNRFLKSLGLHIRYLNRIADSVPEGEARLRVRIALAVASVSMPMSAAKIRRASRRLDRELDRQILMDGGHSSRNPCVCLDLLLDLLPLRQTYVNLGHDLPARLISCIDRIYPALRFFRHHGGELALFNGSTAVFANELMAVLRYEESAGAPFKGLPDSGYERLSAETVAVIVDTGIARSSELSRTAHAGCLSFELSSGRHRFIVNAGAPRFAGERLRQAARMTAAHSTVTLDDTSSSRFSRSPFLGPIITSGPSAVTVRRNDIPGASEGIVASHDGYLEAFGLYHERDLSLNSAGRNMRGRDRLIDREGEPPAATSAVAVARFHVHPKIRLRKDGDHSVYLSAPDGDVWLFTCRDARVLIEDDVFFADPSGVRESQQLVVSFTVADTPEIQWSFALQGQP